MRAAPIKKVAFAYLPGGIQVNMGITVFDLAYGSNLGHKLRVKGGIGGRDAYDDEGEKDLSVIECENLCRRQDHLRRS
jgi:hypothetical protein